MKQPDFEEAVDAIVSKHKDYDREAYFFIRRALDYTVQQLGEKGNARVNHHVSGQELLEGIRIYALDQYGPMAFTLFESWGIHNCQDFGKIVFNLVNVGIFGKTKEDNPKDFNDGYSFKEAFKSPFIVAKPSVLPSKEKESSIKEPKKKAPKKEAISVKKEVTAVKKKAVKKVVVKKTIVKKKKPSSE